MTSIKTSARVRCLLPWERPKKAVEIDQNSVGIPAQIRGLRGNNLICGTDTQISTLDFYEFNNGIWDETVTNEQLFVKLAKPLCDNLLTGEGYNSMLCAYGQTGSGKTYTLLGKRHNNIKGILPMMLDYFRDHSDVNKVTLSAVEVYGLQETKIHFFDLFEDINESTKWDSSTKGIKLTKGQHNVWKLKETEINSDTNCNDIIWKAVQNGRYAPTSKNPDSSRGHSIYLINITYNEEKNFNNLLVLDLAGSEGITALPPDFRNEIGEEMYQLRKLEAGIINYGLSELKALIHEAGSKRGLKPYKGSGIRKFLYPFLVPQFRPMISMVFTISQSISNIESTKSTLRISQLLGNVKIKPRKIAKKQTPESIISSLKKEMLHKDAIIHKLKTKMHELRLQNVVNQWHIAADKKQHLTQNKQISAIEQEIDPELDVEDLKYEKRELMKRTTVIKQLLKVDNFKNNDSDEKLQTELFEMENEIRDIENAITLLQQNPTICIRRSSVIKPHSFLSLREEFGDTFNLNDTIAPTNHELVVLTMTHNVNTFQMDFQTTNHCLVDTMKKQLAHKQHINTTLKKQFQELLEKNKRLQNELDNSKKSCNEFQNKYNELENKYQYEPVDQSTNTNVTQLTHSYMQHKGLTLTNSIAQSQPSNKPEVSTKQEKQNAIQKLETENASLKQQSIEHTNLLNILKKEIENLTIKYQESQSKVIQACNIISNFQEQLA